jgi:hypothetical protein
MKTKIFLLLSLLGIIIPNLIFAQYVQQGPKLVGTGSVSGSAQGLSVALSSDGNTAVVGGGYDNGYLGATWVFTRGNGVWTQQGSKLVGTGMVGTAWQGNSVAVSADGNTAVVGGPVDNGTAGAVWIFTRSGGVWTQQGSKLVGTGAVGTASQGYSVAISSDGNTVITGGFKDNNNKGAAWIFTRSGGVWTQQGSKLVGTGATGTNVYQGWSVSVSSDGNTAIVGGYGDNASTGAVWVFSRSGGVWTQQGTKLVGTGSVGISWQGTSVAISSDGNTFAEGGAYDNSNQGATWIFTMSGGVWTQQGTKLIGTGSVGLPYQGWSVALTSNGNTLIEGGLNDNNNTGAVWIFTRSGSVWTQSGTKLVGTGAIGTFVYQGWSVAISSNGNTAIEGAYGDNTGVGAVWVFVNPSIGITTISTDIPKNYSLSQNYPNPFNPSTSIRYDLPKNGIVKLVVFDELGREIKILVNENQTAGTYEATFNASQYPSGVYFYKLITDGFSETKKMLMIK